MGGGGGGEIPDWLEKLGLAPTYYPTDTEFGDPIAYITKIEKQASAFGICKVVPPLPKPSKRFVFSNLNKSLLKCPDFHSSSSPLFTTRHQELGGGGGGGGGRSSNQHVWQSGQLYTLEQFQSKAKSFARNQLSSVKQTTTLLLEASFWNKASSSRTPIYTEYANDIPGSGFGQPHQLFHTRRMRRRRRRRRRPPPPQFTPHINNNNTPILVSANNNISDAQCHTSTQGLISDEIPSSKIMSQTSSDFGNDAGWKLSNSPWNLQLIARSPGSLTRFMLDDIPGVTSPMIYIGMLFSWFAWHVEDHELHSLNYLHTGSPKSWYAVPGDYAFHFEEVIRSKGYGGNLDRLAALTLLGEKTNLLSPEVVSASGIPCCRLVQNPGEFVVTFPRAYHIGFSHGFNCGEAANFGTLQWLKVAKAAAVRRAAMNYLPMLSHQQLLYMLTMSFVSRVPRALLPGARTSRLKDRQKEEREIRVKKSFLDDMLNEENLFSVLLGKESTFYAVLWDPEALTSPGSVSDENSTVSAMSTRRNSVDFQKNDNCDNQALPDRLAMETLEDPYIDNDDLPCGLHVDSGALACVACGVLGFPFMSIIQPSQRASEELFPTECQVTQGPEVVGLMNSDSPSAQYDAVMKSDSDAHNYENENVSPTCGRDTMLTENHLWKIYTEFIELKQTTSLPYPSKFELHHSMRHSVDDNLHISEEQHLNLKSNSHKKWNISNEFLNPRVFCLEHGLEIEELLHSKGGANVLIICHSAYTKIRSHSLVVAEEIGAPFDSEEVPLQCASKQDMNLITISIDDRESLEDWTSRLGVNLRYCVKLRKISPSKQEQHALSLGGLFSDTSLGSDHLSLKWKSRKSRTPYRTAGPSQSKSCGSTQIKKCDILVEKTENAAGKSKVIQYSRRGSNCKSASPLQSFCEHHNCFLDKDISKYIISAFKDNGNELVFLNKPPIVNSEGHCKDSSKGTREVNEVLDQPRSPCLVSSENTENDFLKLARQSSLDYSELQHDSCTFVDSSGTSEVIDPVNSTGVASIGNISKDSHGFPSMENCIVRVTEAAKAREVSDYTISVGSLAIHNLGTGALEGLLKDPNTEKTNKEDRGYNNVALNSSKVQHITLGEEESEMCNISDPVESHRSQPTAISYVKIEARSQEEDKVESQDSSNVIMDLSEMNVVENQISNDTFEVRVCDLVSSGLSLSSSVVKSSEVCQSQAFEESSIGKMCSLQETVLLEETCFTLFDTQSTKRETNKRRRELDQIMDCGSSYKGFIKGPCEGLRPRTSRIATCGIGFDMKTDVERAKKKTKISTCGSVTCKGKKVKDGTPYRCDFDGCRMTFNTKDQLSMHKRNKCTHKGCWKQFRSHRYAVLHQRVHVDERPLKCPWKGCPMSFKWAWARTEHLRVHTGERPYKCKIEGCGLTFRFVSDFSRHRRKSGHFVELPS